MATTERNESIRNIAIIAHVDHGKTTLVDFMLRQSGTFRENQDVSDRVMDSMDLERERGITISAKNCSVQWKDTRINIIDTPGHADFGGEVERALMMVDGAVLLVDSSEGPLPQTRFVLSKALARNLPIVVVVNKIDRKDARPKEVLNSVYDLFIDLDANESQIEFPVLYAVGRLGQAGYSLEDPGTNLDALFDTILKTIPGPSYNPEEPFQMLVLNIGYSDYVGRLAIGKVVHGSVKKNEKLMRIGEGGIKVPLRVNKLQTYRGVSFEDIEAASPGDIVILAGAEEVHIGDTISTVDRPKALPRVVVDEPTIAMEFTVNSSPFSGKEGKIVQSQKLRERLEKEVLYNVALQLEDTPEPDTILVKGRGEFQMCILIETMRREGFELCVRRPKVLMKDVNGQKHEPIEHVFVDCDESSVGIITERLAQRKGRMTNMVNHGTGRVRLEFSIPSRGLLGYRNQFLTDTRGTGIMSSYLAGYELYRGDFPTRLCGSLCSDREGEAVAYAIFHLEPRGQMFVVPGDKVYEGMIVGEHNRDGDLWVNACKTKKLTNVRAASKDENVILTPVVPMNLERAIDFIRDDEVVEVTPLSIRLRKRVLKKT